METRIIDVYEGEPLALRIEREADKPPRLAGYAIRFNSLSKDLGGFRERVMPGALDAAIGSGGDIRALMDHDAGKLLGRTSVGTLRVGIDELGLWFNVDLPDTQYARDLESLVVRGDTRGMSFGFTVPRDGGERFVRENGGAVRELLRVDLKEITVTSIPAYTETSLYLRVDPELARRIPPAPTPKRDAAGRKLKCADFHQCNHTAI
jgi:HK97 family phage prohead protease